MRIRIPFFWLFISLMQLRAQKQDVQLYPDGSSSYSYYSDKDSFLVSTYPNGKRESKRSLKQNRVNGLYLRWYENGALMWRKQMKDDQENGKAEFFDKSGKKVAVLNYCKGKICDTIFVAPGRHLLLGHIYTSSRVVGGAVREDGQANISEHTGVYARCAMYAVKTEENKKPVCISNFSSDAYGDFFMVVPEGNLGFYPKTIRIESIGVGHYVPPQQMWNSGQDSWSVKGPLEVKPEDKVLFIELHHTSVGYAP